MNRFFAAATLLTFSMVTASAAIIPTLAGTAASAGGTTFLYTTELAAASELDTTEREDVLLVIYDFAGFTGNWASTLFVLDSTPMSGPGFDATDRPEFPAGGEALDDPNIQNLVFRYIGPYQSNPPSTFIDVIEAESIYSQVDTDRFRGQGSKFAPGTPSQDMSQGTSGFVEVPTAIIPEPATMGLLGSALVGLGILAKRRRA